MRRSTLSFAMLIIVLSCGASEEKSSLDADHLRIYELAVRHFIEARPVPQSATLWVAADGRPAPKELIAQFSGQLPRVRANPGDPAVHHKYWCNIQDGTTIQNVSHITVSGTPDHGAHFYRFKKQRGDWVLLDDAAGYVDQQ
jgi:hypothetical protein